MKEYKRKYPLFSLCGLNCGLCPRFQSEGTSRCPGCGGGDFCRQHPSCAVITCAKKHGDIEFCFECGDYPCERYKSPSGKDSFITYLNISRDMRKAADGGIEAYITELNEKVIFLEYLIRNFNDGRKKSFYCTAVNILDLSDLNEIKDHIQEFVFENSLSIKEKIRMVERLFYEKAKNKNVELKLRK